jgi:hypothetical protein
MRDKCDNTNMGGRGCLGMSAVGIYSEISIDMGGFAIASPKVSSKLTLAPKSCSTATFYGGSEIGRESLNDTIESIS